MEGSSKRILLAAVLLVLAGCQSLSSMNPYYWFADRATTLTLTINAGAGINSSRSDVASPLQVRLYELQSPELFQSSDFLGIYLQDESTLQHTLLKKHVLPAVHPGSKAVFDYTLDKATRYIALFGEFEDYNTAVPSAVYKIKSDASNALVVTIDGDSLRIAPVNH